METEPARERSLRLEKTLGAPPERVFGACVEPEKLAEWWGPAGFTATSVELDVHGVPEHVPASLRHRASEIVLLIAGSEGRDDVWLKSAARGFG